MSECPNSETLVAWLDQQLDEADTSTLEEHIEACPKCQAGIEQILSGVLDDTVVGDATPDLSRSHKWASTIANRIAQGVAETDQAFATDDHVPAIDGYEIQSLIARGGMGVVYRARQLRANRTVALKLMLQGYYSGPEAIARFQVEARAAAALTHQYIVPVFDVGISDGHHYFSMGYIDGLSGRELLQQGPMGNQQAAELVQKVADAVDYAHRHGVIHRDLKPGNILIDSEGNPHLTDFGLARDSQSSDDLTATGQVLGTPGFMAPEQAQGKTDEVGAAADIYALGALLYNCLTGRPPFQGQNAVETLRQVIDEVPMPPRQRNSAVDADLETICLKCLEKSADRRYESADDVRRELSRYLEGRPIEARPLSSVARLWRWCRRRPAVAGLTAGIACSLLVGTVVSTYFALLATRRAQSAEQGTRIALTSLETILHTVQDRLRTIPGARPIRRELLQLTLNELEVILNSPSFRSRVDRDIASVHVDLARLYEELGGEQSGGRADDKAEASYRLAVDMFDRLVVSDPDPEPDLRMDQTRAILHYGHFLSLMNRLGEAEAQLKRALLLLRQLRADHPDSLRVVSYLAESYLSLAENSSCQGRHDEALQQILLGIPLAKQMRDAQPDDQNHWDAVFDHHLWAGHFCLDLRRMEEARRYYENSLQIATEITQRFGETFEAHDNHAFAHEALGQYWRRSGEPLQARDHYEKMLSALQKAQAIDPENRTLTTGLVTAYTCLTSIYRNLGDDRAAELAAARHSELAKQLARPDSQ